MLGAQAGTLRWMNSYQYEGGWHSREQLHDGIVCRDGNYVGCGYVGYRNTSMSQESRFTSGSVKEVCSDMHPA